MPQLKSLYHRLCTINLWIGRLVGWLAVIMVMVQFVVVLLRYIFGYSSIFAQESIVYMHALLFMLGAGYTYIYDGHVRVDIFYQAMSPKAQAKVNIFGVLCLLFPFLLCVMITTIPYAAQSWAVFEGSRETSGIQAVFLLKSSLYAFCAVLALQGLAVIIKSFCVLGDDAPQDIACEEKTH